MNVLKETSIKEFLDKNEELLLKRESEHNLILGWSHFILHGKGKADNPLIYTIYENGHILGQAMRTHSDKPLILSHMPEKAVTSLVTSLKEEDCLLEGVVGPIKVSEKFAELWSSDPSIGMHQGVYQLDKVIHPDYQGGELRLATADDLDLVASYAHGFMRDCFPGRENSLEKAQETATRHIQGKTLYLWFNSEQKAVSMAAKNRESQNGTTISWVYTPPEHRKHGYASKVVASLSQNILDDGKLFCNLYTDLLNPTSNSIYQKIGYQKVGESMHYNFSF